jgi:Calx-beta domain/FG-GAP-like repeat
VEPNETVLFSLTASTVATLADAQGAGTIVADDGLLVAIADKTSTEGNSGTTPISFKVTLSQSPVSTVTIDWATADATATSPADYQTANGTVTFNAGETSKTITVQIVGDNTEESYETFLVNLSNPTGSAALGDGQGQGTITNTDGSTDRSRLMFHNFVTNRLYRWHMKNGNTLDTFNWVTPWATDPGWTVGAVADFDQDGQLDYLWHNVNDGRMLFWYVDGDNLKGFQFLPYLMGPPWRVSTTFDANGDGAEDVVYYNSTTGVVKVVLHDNAVKLSEYDMIATLPGTGTIRVVAAADVNVDGDDELVLYNSATGQITAWDVVGNAVSSTITYPETQSTTQAYSLVSTRTDFNDDGKPDLLWHNPTPTGVFSVWFMNGTTRTGVGQFLPFTATDPVWKVVGSANVWP